MNKPDYHVVSLSGGKDSTAMLLGMIERNMPIDCILYADTGLDFPQVYRHIDKLEKDIGRKITRVKAEKPFSYYMFDIPLKSGKTGYGWPCPYCRWCTGIMKNQPIRQYIHNLRKKYNVIEYVGLTADEVKRLERKCNQRKNCKHPLIDWGWTEEDCLKYCYANGYDWEGLYNHFKRLSCWCCPLATINNLRQLYKYFPELWAEMRKWDDKLEHKFRRDYSIAELETRFNNEA